MARPVPCGGNLGHFLQQPQTPSFFFNFQRCAARLMIKIQTPNVHHTQMNGNNTRFLGNKNTSSSKKDKIKIGCAKTKTQLNEFNLHTKAIISMCSWRARFDAEFSFEASFGANRRGSFATFDLDPFAVSRKCARNLICNQIQMNRAQRMQRLGMLEIRIYSIVCSQPDRRVLCTST